MKVDKIIESLQMEYLKSSKVLKTLDDMCKKNSLCVCCRQNKSTTDLCKKCQKRAKNIIAEQMDEEYQ